MEVSIAKSMLCPFTSGGQYFNTCRELNCMAWSPYGIEENVDSVKSAETRDLTYGQRNDLIESMKPPGDDWFKKTSIFNKNSIEVKWARMIPSKTHGECSLMMESGCACPGT